MPTPHAQPRPQPPPAPPSEFTFRISEDADGRWVISVCRPGVEILYFADSEAAAAQKVELLRRRRLV